MLIELANQLKEAGVKTSFARRPAGDFDAILDVDVDGIRQRFVVEIKSRSPYPNELDTFLATHDRISEFGTPLLLTSSISESVGNRLIERGWSWADLQGNLELRASGIRLRQRVPRRKPMMATRPILPQGPGALAMIRFLIRDSNESAIGPTELSHIARVTQPRASQVLSRLHAAGLVERVKGGWRADREALLDAFLNEYRGPGGLELYFYSLDTPTQATFEVVKHLAMDEARVVVSADVGPDLIAPWRSPTTAIIYVDSAADTIDVGLVSAKSRDDANVVVCVPDDTSVFRLPTMEADMAGSPLPLSDETQMIWDLHNLGGNDRVEAAGEMKKWLLRSR